METKSQNVVGHFTIPEELAKELSELLTKQVIRERLLSQFVVEPEKFRIMEQGLIPIVAKIEAIKMKITKEYVPAMYMTEEFVWNYNGWEVDENQVEVIEMTK